MRAGIEGPTEAIHAQLNQVSRYAVRVDDHRKHDRIHTMRHVLVPPEAHVVRTNAELVCILGIDILQRGRLCATTNRNLLAHC